MLFGHMIKELLGIHAEHKRYQKTKDRQKVTSF